jgi:hypothetical protein
MSFWQKSTEIYTDKRSSKHPIAIFMNSMNAANFIPPNIGGQNQWHRIDLKPLGVSADAKSAFLCGLLVITHGTNPQEGQVTCSFKSPSSTMHHANYMGQSIESHIGGGQRSNIATWCPLENGEFDFSYNWIGDGLWSANCSYGINLSLQAWTR